MARFYHTASRGAGGSPRVFLATQAYEHTSTSHDISVLATTQKLDEAGIPWERYVVIENCHVDDCRNAVLREFMQSSCTDIVFLDADVFWNADDLVKLVRYDRDIVAGVYPKRARDQDYPVFVRPGTELYAEEDGCVEVDGVPAGFLRIRRNVVETLMEAHKGRRYLGQDKKEPFYTVLFERVYENGARWGGDYEFCRKAKAAGFKVHVDPEMALGHEGGYPFYGTLGEHWKRKHGVWGDEVEAKAKLAMAMLRSGEPTVEDFAALATWWDNISSAPVDLLSTLYWLAREARGPVLECGSGLSSLVMAAAGAKVTVLENDPVWATKLRDAAELMKLDVNLQCHALKGGWYDTRFVDLDERWALVFCDGPWRAYGKRSLLFERMNVSGAVIVMDDMYDPDQSAPFEAWAADNGYDVHRLTERFAVAKPMTVAELSGVA